MALKASFFRGFKLTKNVDPGKYVYSGYGIGLNLRSEFPLPDSSVDQNDNTFGVDMNSSMHIDNKKKDILILRKGPTQGFEDITLIAEAQYSINYSRWNRKFCLSQHYSGSNSFLFVNVTKIYQFRAKDSEIKVYP